jgi:hypothetical protein
MEDTLIAAVQGAQHQLRKHNHLLGREKRTDRALGAAAHLLELLDAPHMHLVLHLECTAQAPHRTVAGVPVGTRPVGVEVEGAHHRCPPVSGAYTPFHTCE